MRPCLEEEASYFLFFDRSLYKSDFQIAPVEIMARNFLTQEYFLFRPPDSTINLNG